MVLEQKGTSLVIVADDDDHEDDECRQPLLQSSSINNDENERRRRTDARITGLDKQFASLFASTVQSHADYSSISNENALFLAPVNVEAIDEEKERMERERRIAESRIENPQYTFGDLPEHILVDIFNYLNPYQSFSGAFRIRRLDTYGSTNHNTVRGVNEQQRYRKMRREKREVKRGDVKQKNDLGLVCRHWRQAACHDALWKSQAVYLHKQLCQGEAREERCF